MQDRTHSFGYWLRRRRKALDLTQEALAQRVCCSVFSIRKVEADERRPSRRLAERLAVALAVPEAERRDFLDAARALRSVSRLRLATQPAGDDEGPAAPVTTSPMARESVLSTTTEATPFVGRSEEYGRFVALVAQLGAGAGHAVLVEGEPGIGKSRLLREAARHAQTNGLPTFSTKCYEIERAMPYRPVIDLVSGILDRMSAAALAKMTPVSLAELTAMVPELGGRLPDLPRLSNDFPEARQARLSRAVGQLLEAATGRRPSVLMVDDIQWADAASAQVLHDLARHARERAMLVVYAYREEDAGSDERLALLVESLCRENEAQRMSLDRLGTADTAELVAALAGSKPSEPGLAERLHRETEGNPFFLTSILQSLDEGEMPPAMRGSGAPGWLPDALRAAVRVRVAHVPEAIRPVLETAAVLGRRFNFESLLGWRARARSD